MSALLLLGTACAGTDPEQAGGMAKFYRQTLQWSSCADFAGGAAIADAGFQCTRVMVPLDYADPDGPVAQIAISRRLADGAKVGSLLSNPGGPGAPGLGFMAAFASHPIAQRFDLIGVDVRGLGASTPKVVCSTAAEFQAQRTDLDNDFSPAGIAQTEQEHRDYVARCVERTGVDVLGKVGTADVARDFDLIRAVLGDAKLTYFGGSYGTRLGSTLAEMFPDRIRAMVLDGGIDPAAPMIDWVNFSAGFQRAFDAYAADCATAPTCPVGTDPARATEALRALLNPLIDRPATTTDPRGLGYLDALSAVTNSLYSPLAWPGITAGLTELAQGRGDKFLALADLFASSGVVDRDLQTAVLCLEEPRVTDRAVAADLDRRTRAVAPIFDDGRATGQAPLDVCAFWPLPTASQPRTPTPTGLPPVVVVSTTGDPATPHQGGVNLAHALDASLITYEGVQHGVVGQGVACVDDAVLRYLVDLTPPPAELRCA
ncbi:alpha/beta hydrolase [Nocardia sp. NPDC059177]|uniref:alpha/beta hydrolase n=1 Tax=Nocardia sp. NPDC059177 TaxID=3346759 RepID=UPI0036B34219